ncbi:universal stress protein [Pseudarthrobacter sulfonivorans]|uniref:universal stress protein n=1 Tax=Pseudarthrobacter sulfonivorans TaxID=121292 RepID=UPI00285B144E|nr:universal stress protein [Pseudarthrobacter sulfonivorans]MDR6416635.1 nucleotide-binding universal stress UspA family protein [Pseudarthrobacter sulfonivorans]
MSVAVGYVASQEGRAALSAAIREAALRRTDLQILGPVPGQGSADADIRDAIAEAAAAGVAASLREGDDAEAADLMIDASYEEDVELIVIGVRRRSPVGKLFLGSTAQRVILEAGCPVTAVKADVGPRT